MHVGAKLVRKDDGKVFTVVFLSHWSDLLSEDGEKVSVKWFYGDTFIGSQGGQYILQI